MTTTFSRLAVGGDAVDRVVHPDELDVRLVDHDQHVGGHLGQEGVELGLGHGRPGRVVRRADQHDLGAVGDRGRHRVEVVPTVRQHGDPHDRGRGRGDRDRVGLEGAPGEDHLVAGIAERLHQLVDQADRARRHGQVLDRHLETLGQRGVQHARAHVGVAVHLRHGRLCRLDHPGQRRVGILVRGELVRRHPGAHRGRLAGDVRGNVEDVGPRLRAGHAGQVSGRPARFRQGRSTRERNSPTATPSTAPVTLSTTSVTSQARSRRASWNWVSSMAAE